jgi:hypothetical protein
VRDGEQLREIVLKWGWRQKGGVVTTGEERTWTMPREDALRWEMLLVGTVLHDLLGELPSLRPQIAVTTQRRQALLGAVAQPFGKLTIDASVIVAGEYCVAHNEVEAILNRHEHSRVIRARLRASGKLAQGTKYDSGCALLGWICPADAWLAESSIEKP